MTVAIRETSFPYKLVGRGKVRDIYEYPNQPDWLLVVTTDRISVFDVILPDAVPNKGRTLNKISRFFSAKFTHERLLSHYCTDPEALILVEFLEAEFPELVGMIDVWHRTEPLNSELIMRCCITGSLWDSYQSGMRTINGQDFPDNLRNGDVLANPIGRPIVLFTPSTKAEVGHDVNISVEEYIERTVAQFGERGERIATEAKDHLVVATWKLQRHARERGFVVADTKYEVGVRLCPYWERKLGFRLYLIDEVATPDSSRLWRLEDWKAGNLIPYDKQIVRNYVLEEARKKGLEQRTEQFDQFVAQLSLPAAIIDQTQTRYQEIADILTS